MALMQNSYKDADEGDILSKDNLTLCKADYFETCWCKFNVKEPIRCPYLLRHVISSSNSSYICVYHTIRKVIDCFKSSSIFPKTDSVSNLYIYLTICIFVIGIIGNGLSIIILCEKTLRRFNIYRNLTILCTLNIFYLIAILIRHRNTYNQDLRDISPTVCRLHSFIVAFTGHLCSWQLVSTSIQRVYALLSLQSRQTKSWIRTLCAFFLCIVLPLCLIDGQILLNYGLFCKRHICDDKRTYESKQFQRVLNFTENISKNVPIRYYSHFFQSQSSKVPKCGICILWNIFDTLIYAIIPFLIILSSSIIIIIKMCERRRSAENLGGICHKSKGLLSSQDNLSVLLITINCVFLIMTGPFNVYLIIQSILKYFFSMSLSKRIFFQLDEYLRLLQNSYHALSFIFYCVIGNKFRQSAWKICRKIYYTSIKCSFGCEQRDSLVTTRCVDRRRSPSNGPTISTSTNDINKRPSNVSHKTLLKKQTYLTVIATERRTKRANTCL